MAKKLYYKSSILEQMKSCLLLPAGIAVSENVTGLEHFRQEIVYVCENVDGYEQVVGSILAEEDEHRQVDIVVLERKKDGVEQIATSLASYDNIDTVHIISHGVDGAVNLGNTWLNMDNLDEYGDTISNWCNGFSENTELLFYGSDIIQTDEGQEFVDKFSLMTKIDVIVCYRDVGLTQSATSYGCEISNIVDGIDFGDDELTETSDWLGDSLLTESEIQSKDKEKA